MKSIRSFCCLVLLLLGWQAAFGQTWLSQIGIDSFFNESPKSILELPDRSLMFVGNVCIHPLADPCGKMVVGKTDSLGKLQWLKQDYGWQDATAKYWNGRVYAIGLMTSFVFGSQQYGGMVMDENGDTIATKRVGKIMEPLIDFDRADNGDFLITGLSYFKKGAILIRTDSLFNQKWAIQVDSLNDKIQGFHVRCLPNGDVQLWEVEQYGSGLFLKQFDSNGNLLFEKKTVFPFSQVNFYRTQSTQDNGLVCLLKEFGTKDWMLARFDPSGELLFLKKVYEGNSYNECLEVLPNGNFLVSTAFVDVRLMVFTPDGFLNGQLIDTLIPEYSEVNNLALTSGGSIVATGLIYYSATELDSMFIAKWDGFPASFNHVVSGLCYFDEDKDCQKDQADPAAAGCFVRANSPTGYVFATTDPSGFYEMRLPNGQFTLEPPTPSPYWETCPSSVILNLTPQNDSVFLDFGQKKVIDCPYLNAELTIPRLRRCFNNPASVHFCNLGTIPADPAHLDLTLDPWISLTAASEPFTALGGGIYRFELGEIAVFECRDIGLTIHVDCDSTIIGQTHCVEAQIFPDSSCLPPTASWSGASIEVDATCQNDTLKFFIQNTGSAPTSVPCDFIVIEDDVIMFQSNQTIGMGQTIQLAFPADGHFWRLEASQEPGHPGLSMPSVSVQGCNGWSPGSLGFWTAFPQDDGSPAVDVDCLQNIGSFDPNEKTAAPEGIESQHFIHKNQDIEYAIHFQNTGTDTAFTVVVTDTIDQKLRPETLRLGGASHPYSWEITGPGILKMTFEKINLPDSSTNLAGSQGWFSYRVSQKADLADGSQIRNRAAIFFDFNTPVLTNRTLHTIGTKFLSVKTWQPAQPDFRVQVFPNPTSDEATFLVKGDGIREGDGLVLQLFDLNGRLVLTQNFTKNGAVIYPGGLADGLYFFKINRENGEAVGAGKLLVE